MPLENRYLKYSPEITEEIFTLIWDKLVAMFPNGKIYDWQKINNVEVFKKCEYISIWGEKHEGYTFGLNNNPGSSLCKETTVQEILGYDPFVEEFVLPKRWCVKANKENNEELWNYCKFTFKWHNGIGYITSNKTHFSGDDLRGYTEIAFEQFKKYVLKEPELIKEQEGVIVLGSQKDWSKATEEELLEEAKRRYPICCKYKSTESNIIYELKTHLVFNNGIIDSTYMCHVYHKNKWAEIVYLPDGHPDKIKVEKEFKVGDYVIRNGKYASVILLKEPTLNIITKRNLDFRYATLEEINNYLISVRQIPANNVNTGIKINNDNMSENASYRFGIIDFSKPSEQIEFNYLPEPK